MKRIGVFDSGLGGLTVLNEICKYNQNLELVYFGDTARVPYGSRTVDTISHYAEQDVRFLLSKDVEAIVIACGTVSAIGLNALRNKFSVPIFGVIEAACEKAVKESHTRRIAVLGTKATIRSHAYLNTIQTLSDDCRVTEIACPLLVPLIENGFSEDDPITELTLKHYLDPLMESDVDTVILGCTHYPYLDRAISNLLPFAKTINIGTALSKALKNLLPLDEGSKQNRISYYVSDPDTDFQSIANGSLDVIKAESIITVNIENY